MRTDVIYNGDCIQGLKRLPDNSVDIVVTSPPYNIGGSIHHNKNMYNNYDDNLSDDEYLNFIRECLNELLRVTKYYVFFNFQILSNNKNSYLEILHIFKENIKEFFIWAKPNPAPGVQPGLFANGFEFIICFSKFDVNGRTFKHHYTKQGKLSNTIIQKTNKDFVDGHFACFGKWLPKFFVESFTKENDIVLDPFMGSGTTAKACYELNRRFIGFELDLEYCEIARKRLKQKLITGFFGTQANSTSSSFNKDLTGNSDEFPQILPLAELR